MKNRIISFISAAVIFFCGTSQYMSSFADDSSYGTEVPELLDLYKSYRSADNVVSLYFEEATAEYSSYCSLSKENDTGYIQYYADSAEDIDIEHLRDVCGCGENELYLRGSYSSREGRCIVYMMFYSDDHDANYEAAMKMTNAIAEEYVIYAPMTYIDLGKITVDRNEHICWNDIRRIDEYGFEAPLTDELTEKQIAALNSDIINNSFSASIDADTGSVVFEDNTSEKEKLEFALWLKENYGFYAYTYSAREDLMMEFIPPRHEILFYTDIPGDVNNDGELTVSDLVTLNKYLWGAANASLVNWNNGDLCKNGRLDIYDLVELRKLCTAGA